MVGSEGEPLRTPQSLDLLAFSDLNGRLCVTVSVSLQGYSSVAERRLQYALRNFANAGDGQESDLLALRLLP